MATCWSGWRRRWERKSDKKGLTQAPGLHVCLLLRQPAQQRRQLGLRLARRSRCRGRVLAGGRRRFVRLEEPRIDLVAARRAVAARAAVGALGAVGALDARAVRFAAAGTALARTLAAVGATRRDKARQFAARDGLLDQLLDV